MKRKFIIIGGIALIVLAIAGVFVWQKMQASTAAAATVQTSKVTRGSLTVTVSASGNVSASNTMSLAFTSSGKVAKVPVKVGDQVKKGDLLMQLDTTDLQLALKTAQTDLASAQATFDSTQASLQNSLKTAQLDLASAQASYESAKATNGTNTDQIIIAKATLDQARVTLEQAQGAYDAIAWRGDVGMTTQAATLQTATASYKSALATYNITLAGINDTALRTAKATLDSKQLALEQAQKNMDTSLRTAQATLENAKVAAEQAQRNLDAASLYSSMDGLVSVVNYGVGDTASSTAVTVVDLSKLEVKVTIAEVDMAKIQVGETAQMSLDAVSDKTYTATVTAIGPVGTVTSGVVNYTVYASIANPDSEIRPGMTATLDIVVDSADNALLVPTKAVKTQGTQKIVVVQRQGRLMPVPVTIGLTGESSVEIKNGLQEGDVVVLNSSTTTTTTTNNPGGMGGMGGLGGMIGGGTGGPPPGGPID